MTLLQKLSQHIEKVDALSKDLQVPELPAGKEWFNSPPLSFKSELRGKITVLDFWTYCCINCIHVLPDLAALEEKYAGYPVAFIGVHSAKFENERLSENIRQAVLRYEIRHPVVNDDEMELWKSIGVRSWPTLVVVGPRSNLLLMVSGEGNKEVLDACIQAALRFYPPETFRHEPLPEALEKDRGPTTTRVGQLRTPMLFHSSISSSFTTGWRISQRQPANHAYQARFKALYSKTGLYFLMDGTDGELTTTLKEDFLDLWTEDVFEVFLWTDERHPIYFEYEISPLNFELPILVPNFGGKFLGWRPWHYDGKRKIRKQTAALGGKKESGAKVKGWRAEFFIPFELLNPLQNVPPKPGTRWRANFYRVDYDSGKTSSWDWARVGPSFHEYQKFGTLLFE